MGRMPHARRAVEDVVREPEEGDGGRDREDRSQDHAIRGRGAARGRRRYLGANLGDCAGHGDRLQFTTLERAMEERLVGD